MSRLRVLVVLSVVAAAVACGPQGVDVIRPGSPGVPSARSDASSAYDFQSGTVVMFGGGNRSGVLADTWTWDGNTWRLQHPAHSPAAREHALMAFDPATLHVALVGGQTCPPPAPDATFGCRYSSSKTVLQDTWEWNGYDWSQLATAHSPDITYYMDTVTGAAYDQATRQLIVVTFVKLVNSASVLATWALQDGDWVQLHPKHSPPDLAFAGPAFDGSSGRLILQQSASPQVDCGGNNPDCAPRLGYSTTWAWDGTDWQDLGIGTASPHEYGSLIEAGTAGVLFIGDPGGFHEWDGKTWSPAAPLPWGSAPRVGWTGAYDVNTRQPVVFGGRAWGTNHLYGDTLSWDGKTWKTVVAAASSPSAHLSACSPSAAEAGYGGGPPGSEGSATYEIAFAEPKAGPCRLDAVVQFTVKDSAGGVVPVNGNPAQIRIASDLTYEAGFVYASFTIANACALPDGAVGTFSSGDLSRDYALLAGSCGAGSGPVSIAASTRTNPNEH